MSSKRDTASGTALDARPTPAPARRRYLSERQAATVGQLTDAAEAELAGVGYRDLTVRRVASRAGVAAATAYTYFGSKEHLVAEVYWARLMATGPRPVDRRRSPAARAATVLADIALVVADATELAAACTIALLADDPEVADIRGRIGTEVHRRLAIVLDDDVDPAALATMELSLTGALLQVGTGHLSYDALPRVLADVAEVALGRPGAARSGNGRSGNGR